MYCLKNDQLYYQLSCINIFRFGLKNLKPLLAAESRSVQLLGEAGALWDVVSFVVVIYAMVLFF